MITKKIELSKDAFLLLFGRIEYEIYEARKTIKSYKKSLKDKEKDPEKTIYEWEAEDYEKALKYIEKWEDIYNMFLGVYDFGKKE